MLKPYEPADFMIFSGWVTGADMLFQFAGTEFSYPLTQNQVAEYQTKHPERRFYIGYLQNNPAFFGEIIPAEGNIPRLGRLLVGDPLLRGRGLGQFFIEMLLRECVKLYNSKFVELYVWDNNISAIQCYKKVGFDFIATEPFKIVHGNEEYNLLKMRIPVK
jgi:GNAT superfamily N-acetyltransferase